MVCHGQDQVTSFTRWITTGVVTEMARFVTGRSVASAARGTGLPTPPLLTLIPRPVREDQDRSDSYKY